MAEPQPEKSARHKRRQERLQLVRATTAPQRVRVLPRDEDIRKAFKNPPGRMGFPAQGSVEWPLDQFTKRRLREGAITLEETRAATRKTEAKTEPPKPAA